MEEEYRVIKNFGGRPKFTKIKKGKKKIIVHFLPDNVKYNKTVFFLYPDERGGGEGRCKPENVSPALYFELKSLHRKELTSRQVGIHSPWS